MIFCAKCREENEWPSNNSPVTMGTCEICGKRGACMDVSKLTIPELRDSMGPAERIVEEILYDLHNRVGLGTEMAKIPGSVKTQMKNLWMDIVAKHTKDNSEEEEKKSEKTEEGV